MQSLSKLEQETIINYNEFESHASVYTHNKSMINKLKKMAEYYPEQLHLTGKNIYGAVECDVPKNWIKIKPPRQISDKQRIALEKARNQIKN